MEPVLGSTVTSRVPARPSAVMAHRSTGLSSSSAAAAGASRCSFSPAIAVAGLTAAASARHSGRQHVRRQGTIAQPGDSETPSNAIEEWLLSLELPTPLKPVLGSSAWASFAASLVQMFVVAGLSAVGTFIEQGESVTFYAQKYPETSGVILALGFDHMYSCPLFLGLLAWLAASLIACTATTQLPLAKKAQRFNFHSSAAMKRRGSFLMRINCPVAENDELATTDKLHQLRGELRKRGFIVRSDGEDKPTQLAASRGLLGKFAPMVVHLALLLSLAGNVVGLVFGASSEVMIEDGGAADLGRVLEAGRRAKGPLYDFLSPTKNLMDAIDVKVEDFRIEYKDDGTIDQFFSKLAIEDSKTRERLYSDEIFVNKPLRFGGGTIYQADWGIDRLQMYLNGYPIVVPCKSLPPEKGERSWAAFLPLELVTAENPTTVKQITKPKEGIVLVLNNMRNVQVYGSDKNLAGVLRSPMAKVEKKMEGMPIQFGEEITVEGKTKLRLDKIVGSTGLIVKNDPGVPLVYTGYALLMPATLLSVLPFVQVWVAVNKDDRNQILVSGRANRNQLSFEAWCAAQMSAAALFLHRLGLGALLCDVVRDKNFARHLTTKAANSFHACGNETPQKRSGEESPTGASRWRTHRSAMLAVKDEEFEIAVQLAAYYVADATEGRLDNGLASNFKSGNKRKLYCCLVQTHIAWHVMVMAACVLHSLLIILEPPPGQSCARGWENVAELFLVLVYVADILLKVAYMGAGTFLSLRGSKIWQTTYAALTAILFLDAALAPCTRLSRPLRPIMLVLRSRSVRNFYTTVLRICPSLLKVLMLLLFILTASSLGMARLLRGSGTRYFTSSLATFQEMAILLLTQDNYKDLLHDLSDHGGLASLLVFFTFVVVGVLFLMQLVLGTVIDTYMEEAQEELRSKRVKQAKGLMRAFSVLDLRKEGHLRQRAFDRLIQKLRPSDSPFERHLKFSLLSNKYKSMVPASSGPSTPARSREELSPLAHPPSPPKRPMIPLLPQLPESPLPFQEPTSGPWTNPEPNIDPIDFLSLHTVLELTFKPRRPAWDVPGVCREQPWWSRGAERLLSDPRYMVLVRYLLWADAAVFLADAECIEPLASLGCWLQVNDLLQTAFLLQMAMQVFALGSLRKAWRFGGSSDTRILLRAELVLAGALTIASAATLSCSPLASFRPAVAGLGALRSLRLAATFGALRRFGQCLADILPAMTQMMGLICVVQYAFAAVALETLGHQSPRGFATFPEAAMSLLQILLNADGTTMAREAVHKARPATIVIFIGYYAIAVLVVVNLVTALMIEFYRASLAENVEKREARQSEITRQVQDLLREMEVVENLGFEVAGSKETGIERLREKFLGRGQADAVDEELLRQVQKEVPLRDLLSLHRSKSGSNFAGSNPTTPGSGVH
ncbi:CCS1 [Symbiodinium sp. KB8]|nr:CCS1 [Symbiodinium sp. KB8]